MVFAITYDARKEIIIKITPSHESKLVLLNTANNLLVTRQKLKEDYDINSTLLKFLRKYSEGNEYDNNGGSCGFAEIELKDEEQLRLCKIIDKDISDKNILYIKCIDWNFLNEENKLDYGCTMTYDEIKKADKRAFVMKNCEFKEIGAVGCEKGVVEFKSTEERMKITNLFFAADINVDNFAKLGMSIGSMENKKSNSETSGSYHFIKHAKASLEFTKYLEPTPDFIKEVEDATNSKDPAEKFNQIIEEYGYFIPTKVILGGRVHFNEHISSTGKFTELSKEIAMSTNAGGILEANMSSTSNYSEGKSNYQKFNCTKLIGGESPGSLENFNEEMWVKSLKENYKKWNSIEFQNPISIFQPLSKNLRDKIIKSFGKRIHYSKIEEFKYRLEEFGRPKKFELKNMPLNIMRVIQNKATDCNIFATIIDMAESTESKDDFFTCQVLCPPNGKPSLIIHCIQKKFKKRECKLKIGWMVIGYYTDDFNFILSDFNAQLKILKNENISDNQAMINMEILNVEYDSYVYKVPPCLGIPVLTKLDSSNCSLIIGHHFFNAQEENKIGAYMFSYCSKDNNYVKLPDFDFYTLIISDYQNLNTCNIIPFEYPNYSIMKKKPYINLNNNVANSSPKFISLFSTQKTNCGPMFLKQNYKKIEIKIIDCRCKCNFKNKPLETSKNYIECSFLDPYNKKEMRGFYVNM
ncbi:unnamed protein product [Rhizophagus irregularis]|uniref:MACPF domain-containing protein n=5 Tax=Rhizophagus irregularis TaxID=588596 RepID=A0A916EJS9_9GLOM|nr:unnamed protein product [Rhizophagus irregularis]CAB5388640.1 unnamed protein product [Rhizophagus irregularis]